MSIKNLHKTGVWLSFLCTIHCLAMPFVVTAMPFLGESIIDESAEHYLILGSIILASVLLTKDFRLHRDKHPIILLVLSAIFSFIGIFIVEHRLETPLIVIGAVLMASAYYINWKRHKAICVH